MKSLTFRFRLRTLFYLIAVVALLSEAGRFVVRGESPFFIGIVAFIHGGIFAAVCYAIGASFVALTAQTTWGQRVGQVMVASTSAAAWIGFVIVAAGRWPQFCVASSVVVVALMVVLVRSGWNDVEGPAPEETLHRLLRAKQNCRHNVRGEGHEE